MNTMTVVLKAVELNQRLPMNFRAQVEQALRQGYINRNEAGRVLGIGPIPPQRYVSRAR